MIGCLHISEFPAWAQQLQNPSLQAVAVYQDGRVIARSRFLRQSGMLLGDPVGRARVLFPNASFFCHDAAAEQDAWEFVLTQTNTITPRIESVHRGTAFFKPYSQIEASQLAQSLAVQVGIGPNRSIARIAAVRCATRAVLRVHQKDVARFLSASALDVLSRLGFDEGLVSRLSLYGLTNLALVGSLTRQHLNVQFGVAGLELFDLLHPSQKEGDLPLYVSPATVREVLEIDFVSWDSVRLSTLLKSTVCRATSRLGGLCCSSIRLQVRSAQNGVSPLFGSRCLKSPSHDSEIISRAADYLFHHLLSDRFEVGAIEITLGGLKSPVLSQAALFFRRPPLQTTIVDLEERFPGMILRAAMVCPSAPFSEDRVRFLPFSKTKAS